MSIRIRLLIIDPQVDFCDGPANGALPVPGATADMIRLAAMIDRLGNRIDDIDVTLDSHRTIDIAHPAWWVDSGGGNPSAFTIITAQDVAAGLWTSRNPAWRLDHPGEADRLDAAVPAGRRRGGRGRRLFVAQRHRRPRIRNSRRGQPI